MTVGLFSESSYPHSMKRVLIVAATAALCSTAHAGDSWPDPSELPSHPEPPDLLTTMRGQKVTTPEQWLDSRRPELKELFQHYMYGSIPPTGVARATVTYTDAQFFD